MKIGVLDGVLEEIATRWDIPGMAVGIVADGQIAYARGFGVQSVETQAPVGDDSIFCVASVSKCFVACAVMQLAERGKLDLDAHPSFYLPYFLLDDERFGRITIRQMLSHTAGIPDLGESEYDELVAHPETDEGAAERFVRGLSSRKMVAAPGEEFHYSNIAYAVLGDIIAKVSGQIFEAYMQEHILRPAGMPDSTFLLDEVDCRRLAVPHLRAPGIVVNPVYPYHRADAPASFLHTTLTDMCRWAVTSLNRGVHAGERILSPASYEQMWTPAASWSTGPFYLYSGHGWTLGNFEGVATVSHGGGGFGWMDFLVLLPEKNRAAGVMTNEQSAARSRIVEALVRTMLDEEPRVGTLSWTVPVSRSIQAGGIQAAYDCWAELKRSASPEIELDPDEMLYLAYQMAGAHRPDLAIEVLKFNLHAFPGHAESLAALAALGSPLDDGRTKLT